MAAQKEKSGTVLVVEDTFVRSFVKTYLQRHDLNVVATGVPQAEDILNSAETTVDLLITNRPDLFEKTARGIPLLYLAAFPDPEEAAKFQHARMLKKPFRPEQLLSAVQDLMHELPLAS